MLLILCVLGADWGRTYWFLATHVFSWKSPDCFCSAPRLPLFCLAPSNETPNELAASFLSFSLHSLAGLHVSPAFAPHVFVSPPPALLADFSIHPPPPPFFLTVIKPFFISCFHAFLALLSHFHSSRLFALWISFPSALHSFLFSYMEGSDDANMWSVSWEVTPIFIFNLLCLSWRRQAFRTVGREFRSPLDCLLLIGINVYFCNSPWRSSCDFDHQD